MDLKLFFVVVCLSLSQGIASEESNKIKKDFKLTIRMPNATSDQKDALVCHSTKLPKEESYILRFTPHASSSVAHHMMVYGCHFPGNTKPYWSCPMFEDQSSDHAVCGDGQARQIVFAWANDAPGRNLPKGVGFRVGGTTGINFLVLQLHYRYPFAENVVDTSGVTLDMTFERQPQQAGYYVLGNSGSIPPQNPAFLMDSACEMKLHYTIYPIGYRTHGHQIAVVNSGYRIRDGIWTQIGRMSPQRPQTFYPTTTPGIDIKDGDIVASRCLFNSMNRTERTKLGPTNDEEMCNFYILYSTFEQKNLQVQYCFRPDTFKWSYYFSDTPADASSLKGIPGADEIRRKYHMDP